MLKKIAPLNYVYLITLLSGVVILVLPYMKVALELEDAEQAYYSQWWRWVYDDQPPLYTWLQIIINKVFGVSRFSFAFLRALSFCGVLLVLYHFSRNFFKTKEKRTIVVLMLALIPVFIDFTFRRLSHTSLLCLVVLLTFCVVQRLLKNKSVLNYFFLGLVVAMGILTKYNYVLVLGAFILVLPINKEIRSLFFNKRLLVAVAVVIVLIAPHFYVLVNSSFFTDALVKSVSGKTNTVINTIPIFTPLLALVKSIIGMLFLLVLVFMLLLKFKIIKYKTYHAPFWLQHVALAQLVMLVLVFVVFNISKVEQRWLLPVSLPFLVLLVMKFNFLKTKKLSQYGFYVFLTIVFIQFIRTPIEIIGHISSSVHFSFLPISDDLQTKFNNKQWVLPDVTYAGNIRLINPDREIYALDDYTLPKSKTSAVHKVIVVKQSDSISFYKEKEMVHFITDFGKDRESLRFYLE